jgi:hypothetical protein
VTMQVFVREHCTMIAAPVQCDVDGIPKGSHYVMLNPSQSPRHRRFCAASANFVTPGALPRLRGRRGRHPWSAASLARPKGSPPWSVASLARPWCARKHCDAYPISASSMFCDIYSLHKAEHSQTIGLPHRQPCSPRLHGQPFGLVPRPWEGSAPRVAEPKLV